MTSNFCRMRGFLKTRPDLDVPDTSWHFDMAMTEDHARSAFRRRLFLPCLRCCGRRVAAASRSAAPTVGRTRDRSDSSVMKPIWEPCSGLQNHKRLLETAGDAGPAEKDMFTAGVPPTTTSARSCAPASDTVYHPVAPARLASMIPSPWSIQTESLRASKAARGRRSVMPTLIGGNTKAPHQIGEKAADMIKAEMRGELYWRANISRHCEERSDEAIHASRADRWIASLRSQ